MTSDGLAKVSYLFGPPPGAEEEQAEASPAEASSSGNDGWFEETAEEPEPLPPVATSARERAWIRTEATPERTAPRSSGPVFTEEPVPAAPARTDLSKLPNFIQNPAAPTRVARDVPEDDFAEPEQPTKAELKTERRASNVSLNALARKGMSMKEMQKLLERREMEPEVIESEIARLEGVGLLDDAALAENLVRTLQDRKGLGKSAIMAELRRRQVGDEAITASLEDFDVDDELERAIEVATKRAGQLRSYDDETAKRRLSAYLQRRGYGGSVLSAAMKAAFEPGSGRGPRFS
ncbi:hypothetical protein EYE40_03110 [Glaciihabitans arcticus]|uniref:Regulatory protein RecX n=1 Tax=Glaciihabitans arcticus TaxID=2668039 RepID=A0A4Q9GTK9_9MICO|nr:regulatory protein RecX [Glaciihabitans arcticus]TBN56467.1 hypothetical protein EYE40_03110 [Glaciihabitans arcticus]